MLGWRSALADNFMSESFAELLEESLANQQIKQGSILTALVVDVNSDVVIVHAGLKSEAVVSTFVYPIMGAFLINT